MSLAVHHNSELGKLAVGVAAIAAFIIIALTWVPDMMAPQGAPARRMSPDSQNHPLDLEVFRSRKAAPVFPARLFSCAPQIGAGAN